MKKILFLLIFSACLLSQPFYYIAVDDYKRVDIFILPQQSQEYKSFLLEEISNQSTQIYIAMYSFTDTEISSAVVNAVRNGSQVYLIIDPTQAGSTTVDEWLEQQGVLVKRKKSSSSFMHDKVLLIESSKVVWTGSANWSSSALSQDNNVIRLENFIEIFNIYKSKFLWLWNK